MDVMTETLDVETLPPDEQELLAIGVEASSSAESVPSWVVVEHPACGPRPLDELGRHATVRDIVASLLSSGASELSSREAGLRAPGNPEDVHKARVATRRLRAQLRALRPVLRVSWTDHVNGELKWLAAVLGEVRDADVIFEALEAELATLPERDVLPAQALLAGLLTERAAAQARLAAALDTVRYRVLIGQLVTAAADPPLRPDDAEADECALSVLLSLVARRWRHVRTAVDGLGDDPSDGDLHHVRKQAKKLRYAAEMAGAVVGKPARRLASAAESMQAVLGEVHDAVVAEDWIRNAVLTSVAPLGAPIVGGSSSEPVAVSTPVAVAAGELIERQRQRYRDNRRQWPKAWKAGRKKKLRSWLKS